MQYYKLIATSLDAAQRRLRDHEVYADVGDMLPLVHVDFVLMESVMVNVLDNAAKYALADSSIQIKGLQPSRPRGVGARV